MWMKVQVESTGSLLLGTNMLYSRRGIRFSIVEVFSPG
jgi:hypothetical protein